MKAVKTGVIGILIVSAVAGTVVLFRAQPIAEPVPSIVAVTPPEPVVLIPEIKAPEIPSAPEKVPEPKVVEAEPVQEIVIKAKPAPPLYSPEEQRIAEQKRYWQHISSRFKAKMDLLANETDPRKRMQLIRQIAPYVRMDTLATLDWVSTLETAEEQRRALEAVNQNALIGIGARIEKDETGLVKIRDTTILSAVGSSGKVENGDYIAGVKQSDGSTIDFKGMSMQEIVKILRGKPGSEVQLLMQTPDAEPYSVSVNRSMIIMEPLFN